MTRVTILNDIQFSADEISAQLKKVIETDLTLTNPEYLQAIKFGYSVHGKDRYLRLYKMDGENFILPRGYGPNLARRFQEHHVRVQWDDQRLTLPPVEFESKIKLRNYQIPAVEALVKKRQGGVVAGCGAGKTQVMLETMARIGQPALWVCHSYELLNQTLKRACEVFGDMTPEEIGIIANGKVSIGKRLSMALVQTLSRADLSTLTDKFGAIFIDEAHHLAAKSFFFPIGQFPAMYRLWASATPEREDGLTEMIFSCGGPILHTIQQSELPTLIPSLIPVETNYQLCDENYTKMISHLTRDENRNSIILETITKEAPGHFSLVLSDRKEHLQILKDDLRVSEPGLRTEILIGTLSHKTRDDIIKRIQNREIDLLFATQLAREGLDITHLDRLFLVTPKRAAGAVTQEVGRIMRPCPGKVDAMVFDFWDSKNPILKPQFWKRRDAYIQLGMVFSTNKIRRVIEIKDKNAS